jgi:hypothetical protein
VKLEAGVPEGRDLPFGREDDLRVLERVFDVVLFQLRAQDTSDEKNCYPSSLDFRSG